MREQYVRSAFGRATQLSRTRTRAGDACPGAAWPALRNGNDSLFLCDITCVRHAVREAATLGYVCTRRVRRYMPRTYICIRERRGHISTLCHIEKGGENTLLRTFQTRSGFAVSRPRRSCENRKQPRRYYDIDLR